MRLNNKGFTLTELLVCIVIFGIVLASIVGFMLTGAGSYNRVNDRLDVQLEAQLVTNQISEFIIDCNAGICLSENTLYILNKTGDNAYTVHVFNYDSGTGEIKYGKEDNVPMQDGGISLIVAVDSKLADRVTGFEPSIQTVSEGDERVKLLAVDVSFEKRSAAYSVSKTIALRNKPSLFIRTNDLAQVSE